MVNKMEEIRAFNTWCLAFNDIIRKEVSDHMPQARNQINTVLEAQTLASEYIDYFSQRSERLLSLFDQNPRYRMPDFSVPGGIAWVLMPGQHTAIHNHGNGQGASGILLGEAQERVYSLDEEGTVCERRLKMGQPPVIIHPDYIHETANLRQQPLMGINTYVTSTDPIEANLYEAENNKLSFLGTWEAQLPG